MQGLRLCLSPPTAGVTPHCPRRACAERTALDEVQDPHSASQSSVRPNNAAQAKEQAVDVRLWKKKHAQARVRREYRTADEVLADAAEQPQAAPKQTIIDMRGPQVRSCCP